MRFIRTVTTHLLLYVTQCNITPSDTIACIICSVRVIKKSGDQKRKMSRGWCKRKVVIVASELACAHVLIKRGATKSICRPNSKKYTNHFIVYLMARIINPLE
jgi:hypothetical protein